MKSLNEIVGENLTFLRKKAGFTQLEFGEKFSYSDKTVSKWENGSVLPSIDVLKQIADFYGVSTDYILSEHNNEKEFKSIIKQTPNFNKKTLIVCLIITIIFTIGMTIYLASIWNMKTSDPNINRYWTVFLWCVPVSALVISFSARRIFKYPRSVLIFRSIFIWTVLASAYVTFLYSGNYWYLFFIGVPLQIVVILIYNLHK